MRVSKINQSTIISLATPGGKSALAIVRCSGPKVKEIIKEFFPTLNKKLPEPNKSKYLEMMVRGNNLEEIIDDVLGSTEEVAGDINFVAATILAKRRRLGPFSTKPNGLKKREKDIASLARAGFDIDIARRIIDAETPEDLEVK